MLQRALLLLPSTIQSQPTVARPAPCWVHGVEFAPVAHQHSICLAVLVDALLLWVLGGPILGQLLSLQLQAGDAVPQVVYGCQLCHRVLDGCLGAGLVQKLVLLRVLCVEGAADSSKGCQAWSGWMLAHTCVVMQPLSCLEIKQNHVFGCVGGL